MKRPMITFDEFMSMSDEAFAIFEERDEKLLAEGLIDPTEPNIDFMGMTDEEIAEKYNFTPMDVVFDRVMKKLGLENYDINDNTNEK